MLKTDVFEESLGEGLYANLTSHANYVVGIDLSAVTAHAAKKRHAGLLAIGADVVCQPFADRTFDVIISISTIDHFESKDSIIAGLYELYRLLKVGGQLIITLDNVANPIIAIRNILPCNLLSRLNLVPYYVGASLKKDELQQYLELVGFEVAEINSIMHFPRILAMAMAAITQNPSRRRLQKHLLNFLLNFERISVWPTRFLTGYFIAANAIKP